MLRDRATLSAGLSDVSAAWRNVLLERDDRLLVPLNAARDREAALELHGGLPETTAAYLFHLAQNRAFVDGNERVAVTAMIMFVNDHDLACDEDELVEPTVAVTSRPGRAPATTAKK